MSRDGEYVELSWDIDEPPWEAVRGHVAADVYAESLRRENVQFVPEGDLEHVWLRNNPDPTGNYTTLILEAPPKQRGAWKATLRRYSQEARRQRDQMFLKAVNARQRAFMEEERPKP